MTSGNRLGELVEDLPPTCPDGHRWWPPHGGIALFLAEAPVCTCRHALRGHHRVWRCQRPGCGLSLRKGRCERDPGDQQTWPRPDRG